jgi:hypothetical protein
MIPHSLIGISQRVLRRSFTDRHKEHRFWVTSPGSRDAKKGGPQPGRGRQKPECFDFGKILPELQPKKLRPLMAGVSSPLIGKGF